MDYFNIIFPLMLVCGAFLGITIARFLVSGSWHKRYIHNCGFHTDFTYQQHPCARCGNDDRNWQTKIMRATFPFGWQTKQKAPSHGDTTGPEL